jgi:hypothetical protein
MSIIVLMFYLIQYNVNNRVNVLSDTVIWEIIFYIKIIYLHELIRNRDIVLLVYERQLISMCIRSGCKSNFPNQVPVNVIFWSVYITKCHPVNAIGLFK